MMVSSEVQRTLVKSPPELWAELSDPVALARHLGELGEVRITRVEPETTVEWEAESITGRVSIKASGWGTKVTLTVTREPAPAAGDEPAGGPDAEPEAAAPEAADASEQATPEAVDAPKRAEDNVEPEPAPEIAQAAQDTAIVESPAAAEQPIQPPRRRGLFARLFGRRRKTLEAEAPNDLSERAPTVPPELGESSAFEAVRDAIAPDALAASHPFDDPPSNASRPAEPEPELEPEASQSAAGHAAEISAELLAAEEAAAEEVEAVLTAVLDRLGAAHHRPFSRA